MLRYKPQYTKRFYYEANKTEVYKFPSGNLFAAMNMLLKLEVNVVTNTGSNAPDFQVFNAIERVELIRDSKQLVWSLSGQALALLFRYQYDNGTAAASNAAIAGAVANNVQGQEYLHCPFHPLDAAKESDFGCDTRAHDYELKIKWRDLTVAGTLFGTISGTITDTDSENYLELELENIIPMPNPATKAPDSLTGFAPLIVGYREDRQVVAASSTKFQIDIPDFQKYRNVILYTTHVANTLQEIGVNTVLANNIKVYDTQNTFYADILAEMLRQKTSRRWGTGSSVPAGMYDINLTKFGSVFDALVSNNTTDLYMDLDVTKLTNATYVRPIYVTQESQGV